MSDSFKLPFFAIDACGSGRLKRLDSLLLIGRHPFGRVSVDDEARHVPTELHVCSLLDALMP